MATVIFKPTEACNAGCVYCDVVHKKGHSPRKMPLKTLEKFFFRLNEFLVERPDENMEVVWHGGEPLSLGPEYFAHALRLQQKHCADTGERIRHCIQSNLTLLTRELAGALKKLGIDNIGSSFDPIGNVRGLGKRRDSDAYNKRFMDAVCLLDDEGISLGIIYVVTKLSLERPLEIFQTLANLAPRGGFMFNPVLVYGRNLDYLEVSPEEYVDFLGAIFPTWWHKRDEFPLTEPFASLARNLLEESRSLMCSDSGACAYHHINVLPDGSLSHCGRSADWNLLDYGSIFDRSFSQVLGDPQREILIERNTVLPQTECKGCRFWDICHGGCPLDAWSVAGSFLHKSEWCYAKKGFIEKYFEPVAMPDTVEAGVSLDTADRGTEASKPKEAKRIGRGTGGKDADNDGIGGDPVWIDPVGGLGDALMVSGVLKQVVERDPSRRFDLVERTKYRHILEGHPAIGRIGHPPAGARFLTTNYWDHDDYRQHGNKAYQVLARLFGLETPIDERLYVPWEFEDDPVLMRAIPWKPRNVLISQSSDSPRKQMVAREWELLVEKLNGEGIGVVQVGKSRDRYVRGAFSLLGLTTPRQAISMVRHFDVVVTSDNFIMHATHHCGVPAIVLWGPTDHRVYGYSNQIHLQAELDCGNPHGCIGPGRGNVYQDDCPEGAGHCMNRFHVDTIFGSIASLLKPKASNSAPVRSQVGGADRRGQSRRNGRGR